MRSTRAVAAAPWLVPVGTKSTTVMPGGGAGPDGGADDAGAPARRVIHAAAAGSVGSTSAMTVTGSVPRAGNRSARTSAVARASDERGRVRASPVSNRAPRNGVPSSTRTTATATADGDRPALHPAGEPVEAALDVGRRRQGLDAPADHSQRRGQQRDGGRHAQQDDGEAGDAERGEQRHPEHEQPGHGDRDRECGEHDGGAGGGDGRDSGAVDVAAVAALLTEPVDHRAARSRCRARCRAC